MGLINSIGSFGDKAYDKISTALVVEEPGDYAGNWDYDPEQGYFFQITNSLKSPLHEKSVTTKKVYTSSFESIELLSSSRDTKGITKAAVGGALLGGGVGAVAGGLFAASKNTIFIKIQQKNGNKFYAYVTQKIYDRLLVITNNDDSNDNDEPEGISIVETGGELNVSLIILLSIIAGIMILGGIKG